jgi:alkylation response protein AidB-like acyl-CoA dehydrogenase
VSTTLSPDQRALLKVADGWLTEHFPYDAAAAVADARPGHDASLWSELADLGWTGLDVDEAAGGSGATLVESVLLAELTGRHLLPAPLVSTWSALPVAQHDVDLVADVVAGRRSLVLAELGQTVADVGAVTDVLVLRDGTCALVPAQDCRLADAPTVDGTRTRGRVEQAPRGQVLPATTTDLRRARARRAVLVAAESVGVGQRCLDLALEHARQRQQFGRPIGSYQGIAFPLVDAHLALERSRSLTYWAAWQLVNDRPTADQAASGACLAATSAAVSAAETSLQTFGGLGMTWDSPLHRWYKRALVNQQSEGTAAVRLDGIADWLLAEGGS